MELMAGASLVEADAAGWNHMDGWGMVIFGWLFMASLAALGGWLIWASTRPPQPPGDSGRRARSLLDERYARGEIARDEYLERRADLER